MVLIMLGLSIGDFHPIYNAPMMGAHKAVEPTTIHVTNPAVAGFAPCMVAAHLTFGEMN